jgi:hypothetical protein
MGLLPLGMDPAMDPDDGAADSEAEPGGSSSENPSSSDDGATPDDGVGEGAPPVTGLDSNPPGDSDDSPPEDDEGEPGEEEPDEVIEEEPEPVDPMPWFSFFVTSQVGLFGLPAGEIAPAPDPVDGYGGNLGGLAGADEICSMLAQTSNPGDLKVWRAFLSTSGFQGGEQVDAIDRIGDGPWYDYNGRLFANDLAGVLPDDDGRPEDTDPQLAEMFTDENGEDAQPSNDIDNHDTLTGSDDDGRLYTTNTDPNGTLATCEDWTSSTLQTPGGGGGGGGGVPVGHSWPRTANNGRQWIQEHTVRGCRPGANVVPGGGAPQGDFRVGAGGGYGGIYCFALGAVSPDDL